MGVLPPKRLRASFKLIRQSTPIQGNLDPVALFAPRSYLEEKVDQVLEQADGRPGHIFNLGHGILPETPVENVEAVIQWVHAKSKR